MYSNIARSDDYKQKLLSFLHCEYGIDAIGIHPAKRGFYGETWMINTADRNFFVKVVYPAAHKSIYESSFPIIDHMNRHGIDFISRIVKTKRGNLSIHYDGAVMGVFDWIDGENQQDEKSKIREYQMLAKIYALPVNNLNIPRENFSAKSSEVFFSQWSDLPSDAPLHALFEQHRVKIEKRAERLRLFSARCGNDVFPFFITHGDAGGNYIKGFNSIDMDYIVDWDTPILAPPERDAWFCMQWDWAMEAFHDALRQNGIDYVLRQERLAYYCYHMFFFYLNAYLDRYTQIGIFDGIEEYMGCWIEDAFQFADKFV